jgi:drug/metabolite transporter (DMT)-like permease
VNYLWQLLIVLLSAPLAVKRGDIRALGALSYATPILSTALLIVCGLTEPTGTLLIAALLVTVGAVLASRELWRR